MVDPKTLTLLERARGPRQVELSARLVESEIPPPKLPDARAEAVDEAWADGKAAIIAAVGRYEGLRVMREEKTRRGLILRGTAVLWRGFLAEERELAKSRLIELREYIKPWHFGLPGSLD